MYPRLVLTAAGFQGVYTNKAGKSGLSVREGQATFFRSSRFQLAARKDLTLKHLFPAKVGARACMKAGTLLCEQFCTAMLSEQLARAIAGQTLRGHMAARVQGRRSCMHLARRQMHEHVPPPAQLHPTRHLLFTPMPSFHLPPPTAWRASQVRQRV